MKHQMSNRVHLPVSWGSWEINEPSGISKMNNKDRPIDGGHVSHIPPPPCMFQPPLTFRSSSKRGVMKKYDDVYEDPFLAALMECTKATSTSDYDYERVLNKDCPVDEGLVSTGLMKTKKKKRKGFFHLSCKYSCSVRDDNLARVSHHHHKNKDGDR